MAKIFNVVITNVIEGMTEAVLSRTDFQHAVTAMNDYFEAEIASLREGPDGEGGWDDEELGIQSEINNDGFHIWCDDLDYELRGEILMSELL